MAITLNRAASLVAFLTYIAGVATAQGLTITPANPTPVDTVRLRWTHVHGCAIPMPFR
jgi:hypothetical protein